MYCAYDVIVSRYHLGNSFYALKYCYFGKLHLEHLRRHRRSRPQLFNERAQSLFGGAIIRNAVLQPLTFLYRIHVSLMTPFVRFSSRQFLPSVLSIV